MNFNFEAYFPFLFLFIWAKAFTINSKNCWIKKQEQETQLAVGKSNEAVKRNTVRVEVDQLKDCFMYATMVQFRGEVGQGNYFNANDLLSIAF